MSTSRLRHILLLLVMMTLSSSSSGFVGQALIGNQRTRTVRVRVNESTNKSDYDEDDACSSPDHDGDVVNYKPSPQRTNSSETGEKIKSSSIGSAWDTQASSSSSPSSFYRQLQSRQEQIQVEQARSALEEQHTQSFLKRRPVKLPYKQARQWVQANLGADTKEEYEDLVENGNLRTPYIPKQPEQYYTSTREWISWDHFLKGVFDDKEPSAIQPQTGVFD
jgi:hypothetical protein